MCFFQTSRFKSQRHSRTSLVAGNIPMRRKGLIRLSGKHRSLASAASGKSTEQTLLTTSPRLMGFLSTLWETEYQFINATHAPESFTAIHVPPPGSDGESTVRPFRTFLVGGKPAGRVSFSSLFMPRQ